MSDGTETLAPESAVPARPLSNLEYIPRDPGLAQEAIEAQEQVFAESVYAQSVRQNLTQQPGIAAYDHADDKNVASRRWQLVLFVVLPITLIGFFIARWLGGENKTLTQVMQIESNQAKTATVIARSGVFPTPPLNYLGGSLPGSASAVAAPRRATGSSDVTQVKCYAVVDDAPVIYPGAMVQAGGLFLAEKFSRSLGGLIYSSSFGWHRLGGYQCDWDALQSIETEFQLPTPTATRRVVPTLPRTAVPLAVPVILPTATPTLQTGISFFTINDCVASWLVWNVRTVTLVEGKGNRIGVAGDDNGRPVSRSIGNCYGTISLIATLYDGTEARRDVVLNK